jgi:AcrR family transcriptional regulator
MDHPAAPTAPARRTAGGPVLQDDVTDAITAAFFEELASAGYGKLSMDAIARRAGTGKAAIYRRWPSKQAMTVALVSDVAVTTIPAADTGSLRGDIRHFLTEAHAALRHPLARTIVPDLLAEATRNTELAEALQATIRTPRRASAARLLQRAIDRGELPDDADIELGLDFLAGPLYWRQVVIRLPSADTYLDRLTDKIIAALNA